jgi:hypothetical protein
MGHVCSDLEGRTREEASGATLAQCLHQALAHHLPPPNVLAATARRAGKLNVRTAVAAERRSNTALRRSPQRSWSVASSA